MERMGPPDKRKADACTARSELDLRIGAIFTRFQTLRYQQLYPELKEQVISYGGCQFPTLGFVVDRFKQHNAFVAEDFWKIQVKHEKSKIGLSLRGALKLVTQMGHRVAPIIKPR